jgi:hypothetical protein
MGVHLYNLSIKQAKTGGLQVQGQPRIYSVTLSQNPKTKLKQK